MIKYLTSSYNVIDKTDDYIDYLSMSVPDSPVISDNPYFDYDFNNGFRIRFKDLSSNYYIVIKDRKNKYIYFSGTLDSNPDIVYCYEKRYFIDYDITIHKMYHGLPSTYPIKHIQYDTANKDILIYIAGDNDKGGLGDSIAWFQSVAKFHDTYPDANIFVCTSYPDFNDLLINFCPWLNFISYDESRHKKFYATYLHGCFFVDPNKDHNPIMFNYQNLVEMGYRVMGFGKPDTKKPYISFYYSEEHQPKRNKPYVCLGLRASNLSKEWLPKNSDDIDILIETLEEMGYDVIIIDKANETYCNPVMSCNIPAKGIRMTGNISLIERAKLLSGASFFIGLSSGLSWLAWSVGIPVVLISGFTNPIVEFDTPYRIINYAKCNSCWSECQGTLKSDCAKKNPFNKDFLECSTSITVWMILDKIMQIPGVQKI